MKVLALNASPRKNRNTATVTKKALEGAASLGAETELIHLYSLNYKGCSSCFACKLVGGPSYGRCAIKDDLAPVLDKMEEADAIIIGTPIYCNQVASSLLALLERFIFQYYIYDRANPTLWKKRIPFGLIYTMNDREDQMEQNHYPERFSMSQVLIKRTFSSSEDVLYVYNTFQFDDYSKYIMKVFDPEEKKQYRDEHFPIDCQNAYNLGRRVAQRVLDGE